MMDIEDFGDEQPFADEAHALVDFGRLGSLQPGDRVRLLGSGMTVEFSEPDRWNKRVVWIRLDDRRWGIPSRTVAVPNASIRVGVVRRYFSDGAERFAAAMVGSDGSFWSENVNRATYATAERSARKLARKLEKVLA